MSELIPWQWYILTPISSVFCTLILARLVMRFLSSFQGSLMVRPADAPATTSTRFVAIIKVWLVYLVTIVVFTLTSGSFSYAFLMIDVASSEFSLEVAGTILMANSALIQVTLLAGLFIGTVVVVIARLMTITYSDFLLRYLAFQMLVPLNLVLISIGMVLSGPGPDFYAAISDFALRAILPDLPLLILLNATGATLATESAIWLMHSKFPRPSRGSYPLLASLLDTLVEGEYTISDGNVTELCVSAIAQRINGDDAVGGLHSLKWFSFSGTEDIARCLRTEVRAWLAKRNYGIPVSLVRRYDELMREQGMESERLQAAAPIVDTQISAIVDRIQESSDYDGDIDNFRTLLDHRLEHEAQDTIQNTVKIITRESVVNTLEQVLGAKFRTDYPVGTRRFIIINEDTLVLTCPVPQVGHEPRGLASNAGILIDRDRYIVNRYSDFFDNCWDRDGVLEDCGPAIDELLRTNIGLTDGERMLILVDTVKPHLIWMAHVVQRRARQVAQRPVVSVECYPSTGSTGVEPPLSVWSRALGDTTIRQLQENGLMEKLLSKHSLSDEDRAVLSRAVSDNKQHVADVVLALSWYSISHTNFREALCGCEARFASMPRLTPSVVRKCKDADYTVIAARSMAAADLLTEAISAKLTAPNGTDLTASLADRQGISDTGLINTAGVFGNIPGGEAYIAPVEESVSGILVFESAPNRPLATRMRLTVEQGRVTRVRGDKEYRSFLLRKFKEHQNNGQVAELGVGTNDKATDPICIREAEKILGTVHIGLGDNQRFGGRSQAPFHEDFVVRQPTLALTMSDNSTVYLVEDGRFTANP